jgi:hypothetical protein
VIRWFGVTAVVLAAGCSGATDEDPSADSPLTGTTSAERGIHFEGLVYVPVGTGDDRIRVAIAREVKTAIGALRNPKVSINDRGASNALETMKWTKRTLAVVDPKNPAVTTGEVVRVTYRYDDRAVVTNTLAARSALDFTMLADDYSAHADPLKTACTDDSTTDTDSLWYHYAPESSACQSKIKAELAQIAAEKSALGPSDAKVGPIEAARWFLPVTAKLDPPKLPNQKFSPEYDRLFGVGTDKSTLLVYAFFGVDVDETNPDDYLAQEAVRFFRTLLRAQPNFRVTKTEPSAMLLDIDVDGRRIPNVTWEQMFSWLVDKSGYPAEVGSDATKIAALRRAALAKLTERWIEWTLPIEVAGPGGAPKKMNVVVRSFFGYEDGSPEARQHAQWRYLEAFWHGDVFVYNGHSHFGHGPLEPTLYSAQNFNDRYQLVLVNSCISFNYYHQDFIDMKPGGSKNLDMVLNGLPSYVYGGGEATARLVTGLLDGKQKPYADLLDGMRLDMPWGERAYDPMRVVDGELDNVFSQTKTPLVVKTLPPVY